MMKASTKRKMRQLGQVRMYLLVIMSCIGLSVLGQVVDSSGGWVSCPPQVVVLTKAKRKRKRGKGIRARGWKDEAQRWAGELLRGWRPVALRSVVVGLLWWNSGIEELRWVIMLPSVVWLGQRGGWMWPGLRRQPEWQGLNWLLWQGQGLVLLVGLGQSLFWLCQMSEGEGILTVSVGCLVCGRKEAWVQVERQADGNWQAEMCGHFKLEVSGDEPFRMRLLLLFLRLLVVSGPERVIGRTRDDRAPFVRQTQIAAWFEVPQPNVSRWERYWLSGNWANLLSLKTAEVLTNEVRSEIIGVCAAFPWWGIKQVYAYLKQEQRPISYKQVQQAVQESGWGQFQQQYRLSAEQFVSWDKWLVNQLLSQVETLLAYVDAGEPLPPTQQMSLKEVQTLAAECGCSAPPQLQALPWLLRVEQLLFGQWQPIEADQVCCIYCGSNQVARKSKQPRLKKYYDEHNQLQTVAVYRFYCRNQACDKGSFTNLPPNLTPYSAYRTETKVLALQMYAWGYSTYRRTGRALGVSSITAYQWVSAWGHKLLPVVALFGLLKSSGVVGVDEKYVLVPKNDKPAGKMRRWMYVYLAVDVYTYDLLHIAIYPHNDKVTAQTFLLALRSKGYQPRVIVTDLRRDYGGDIARVFPKASHHQCIFHALHDVGAMCRKIYGADYAHTQPQIAQLRQDIADIFQAKTKRTALKRFDKIMARRELFVQQYPQAAPIFDFLQRHWPTLVNAIESQLIPKTNNAVEMVIRRFDQHYQNFCGFESIASAQLYLAVFEKLYRFTPFSDDARPAIRGKCPLQLAGYDISQIPMASLCQGLSPDWPLQLALEVVP